MKRTTLKDRLKNVGNAMTNFVHTIPAETADYMKLPRKKLASFVKNQGEKLPRNGVSKQWIANFLSERGKRPLPVTGVYVREEEK